MDNRLEQLAEEYFRIWVEHCAYHDDKTFCNYADIDIKTLPIYPDILRVIKFCESKKFGLQRWFSFLQGQKKCAPPFPWSYLADPETFEAYDESLKQVANSEEYKKIFIFYIRNLVNKGMEFEKAKQVVKRMFGIGCR